MKRRGFLKALGIALATPVVPIAAIAAPASGIATLDPAGRIPVQMVPEFLSNIHKKVGRGMSSNIVYYDELAFLPIEIPPQLFKPSLHYN